MLRSYDLVAVAPGDAAVLRAAVASGAADIVSLELSSGRPPFALTRELVSAVQAAGAVFEVEYAPAVRDSAARRNLVANLGELLRLVRRGGRGGDGVLLTSAAATALELRAPHDAAAVVALAGLTPRAAARAMTAAAAQALRHAEARLGGAARAHAHACAAACAGGAGAATGPPK